MGTSYYTSRNIPFHHNSKQEIFYSLKLERIIGFLRICLLLPRKFKQEGHAIITYFATSWRSENTTPAEFYNSTKRTSSCAMNLISHDVVKQMWNTESWIDHRKTSNNIDWSKKCKTVLLSSCLGVDFGRTKSLLPFIHFEHNEVVLDALILPNHSQTLTADEQMTLKTYISYMN